MTSHHADRRYLREPGGRYHLAYNAEQNGFDGDGYPQSKWVLTCKKESQWVTLPILSHEIGSLWRPESLQMHLENHPEDSDFRASFIALRKDQTKKLLNGKLTYLPGIGLMNISDD
jgi:hypothetical protein